MSRRMIQMKELIEDISMGPFGSDIKVDNFIDQGVPVLNGSNIRGVKLSEESFNYVSEEKAKSLKKANTKRGDIVITHRGTLGQISYIPNDSLFDNYIISQSQFRVTLKKNIVNPIYFTYYFHTSEGQKRLLSFKNHVGVPALAQATTNFRLLDFPIRPINEQNAIAKVLSDLDAKIELNNKINAKLEAMTKLIYDYWFVQFDFPYDFKQGKVADDSSNPKDVKPYKSSGGKMVYNEELKRAIPEGWEVNTLSSWIKNDKSGDWGKESKEGNYTEKVSCIRGADINGLNGKGEVKSPTRFILEKNSHKMLEVGDFIIEISGGSPTQSTGRMAFIIKESLDRFDDPLICSNFCKAVTLKDEKSIFNFSYLWQRLYDAGVLFGWEGKTSGIKNFLFESFVSKHKDPIPPKELMESFYKKVYPIHAKIQTNLKQNQELASLRDWLLPMLMNGQISTSLNLTKSASRLTDGQALDLTKKSKGQEVYSNEFEVGVAAEGGEEYEKKATLNIPENKKGFAKLVLAGKIIKECKDSQEFTNIKFQKLQHLAEHLMEANLKLNYYNQAAGPYDNRFMHTLHNKMRQQKWFNSQEYKYSMMEKVNQIDGYFNNYFGSKEKQFSKIISLLGKASEDQCEIVSTLYAVWNDRIIKVEPIEDELLINDFLDWSERKKRYTAKQIKEAIQWMKDKELEPKGFGELIKHAKKK